MQTECFLDTNVLVYAALGKGRHETKRKIAHDLVVNKRFGISTQVLQEFYANVTCKTETPLTPDEALEWMDGLERQQCVTVDRPLVRIAIAISQRWRINCWDGAILAAAERLGAETLYTEDLSHGQAYGSVRVVNPFI